VTSSVAVFVAAIRVIRDDIIMIENKKKRRKFRNRSNFYLNLYPKDGFRI